MSVPPTAPRRPWLDIPIFGLAAIKNGRYRIIHHHGIGEQAITVDETKIWTAPWAVKPGQIVSYVVHERASLLIVQWTLTILHKRREGEGQGEEGVNAEDEDEDEDEDEESGVDANGGVEGRRAKPKRVLLQADTGQYMAIPPDSYTLGTQLVGTVDQWQFDILQPDRIHARLFVCAHFARYSPRSRYSPRRQASGRRHQAVCDCYGRAAALQGGASSRPARHADLAPDPHGVGLKSTRPSAIDMEKSESYKCLSSYEGVEILADERLEVIPSPYRRPVDCPTWIKGHGLCARSARRVGFGTYNARLNDCTARSCTSPSAGMRWWYAPSQYHMWEEW